MYQPAIEAPEISYKVLGLRKHGAFKPDTLDGNMKKQGIQGKGSDAARTLGGPGKEE